MNLYLKNLSRFSDCFCFFRKLWSVTNRIFDINSCFSIFPVVFWVASFTPHGFNSHPHLGSPVAVQSVSERSNVCFGLEAEFSTPPRGGPLGHRGGILAVLPQR